MQYSAACPKCQYVTGRVCPHNCQKDCARDEFDTCVSIREMERAIGDYMLQHADTLLPAPAPSSEKKIAIIGSGPAGLTAAYYLALAGHQPSVYEASTQIGGMLYYGIPAYRLEKAILDRVRSVWESLGITFHVNTRIGTDISMTELNDHFDCVLAAPGAQLSRQAGIEIFCAY